MRSMQLIFLLGVMAIVCGCATLALPQDPTKALDQFECSNKCAALGMNGVFIGGRCGCTKR